MKVSSNFLMIIAVLLCFASAQTVDRKKTVRGLQDEEEVTNIIARLLKALIDFFKSLLSLIRPSTSAPTSMPSIMPAPTASPTSLPSRKMKRFRIDRNGDQKISKKEYSTYLKHLGIQTDKDIDFFDSDGDGELNFGEIRAQSSGNPGDGNYNNRNPFDVDADGDEEISMEELDVLWTDMGYNFTEEEKEGYYELYDLNNDTIIEENELTQALLNFHDAKKLFKRIKCFTLFPTQSPTPEGNITLSPTQSPTPEGNITLSPTQSPTPEGMR